MKKNCRPGPTGLMAGYATDDLKLKWTRDLQLKHHSSTSFVLSSYINFAAETMIMSEKGGRAILSIGQAWLV